MVLQRGDRVVYPERMVALPRGVLVVAVYANRKG